MFVVFSVSAAVPAPQQLNFQRKIVELRHLNNLRYRAPPYLLHVFSQKMNFFAVFVGYNVATGSSCIGTKYNTILEDDSNNCCSSFCFFWLFKSILQQKLIAMVGKTKENCNIRKKSRYVSITIGLRLRVMT